MSSRRYIAAALAGLFLDGQAVAAPALPPILSFAAGYQLDGSEVRNVVELGVVHPCGRRMCMDVQRFDSARLLPRVLTSHRHRMHAPYRRAECRDGLVGVVYPSQREREHVRLVKETNGFAVITPTTRYRWVADPAVDSAYTLVSVLMDKRLTALQQVVGFAFPSAGLLQGGLDRAQLASFYRGEIHHKTANTGAAGPWMHAQSSIDFRVYDLSEDGGLLRHSRPGAAAVVHKYGKPMWVHSTVVLTRPDEPVAPVVQEYGHDFNMDGCFNEQGHNKFMLPVAGASGQVRALVYIEYTSDLRRGFPMLSVGRYYR